MRRRGWTGVVGCTTCLTTANSLTLASSVSRSWVLKIEPFSLFICCFLKFFSCGLNCRLSYHIGPHHGHEYDFTIHPQLNHHDEYKKPIFVLQFSIGTLVQHCCQLQQSCIFVQFTLFSYFNVAATFWPMFQL